MKPNIHPAYHEITVTCACGNSFCTRSTKEEIHVEICSACHPFFTGTRKLLDSAGRIERFERKYRRHKEAKEAQSAAKGAPQGAPRGAPKGAEDASKG